MSKEFVICTMYESTLRGKFTLYKKYEIIEKYSLDSISLIEDRGYHVVISMKGSKKFKFEYLSEFRDNKIEKIIK